ncbi:MAG: hypothetical protein O6947_07310, partial [Acidobacteria bacterium]|nr:hypothetical protein [Acidobacteriota bacterium]
ESTCRQTFDTFVFSAASRTWEFDVPKGFYEVEVGIGDASFTQGPQTVMVEANTFFDGVTTLPGEHLFDTQILEVKDGKLTVGVGGSGGVTALNFLTQTAAPSDLDSDGILNPADNCPFLFNPLQENQDVDSWGDVCDTCTDVDGDGSGAGFPSETCFLDCNDSDPSVWAVPIEVAGLNLTGETPVQLQWIDMGPVAGFGTRYDIASGSLTTLSGGTPFADACLLDGGNSPTYQDDRVLTPGGGFFYLIRAENSCGQGDFGSGSPGNDFRADLFSASACPP